MYYSGMVLGVTDTSLAMYFYSYTVVLIECSRFEISLKFPSLQISRVFWFLGAKTASEISKKSVCAQENFWTRILQKDSK
jgi:hypothetical protein